MKNMQKSENDVMKKMQKSENDVMKKMQKSENDVMEKMQNSMFKDWQKVKNKKGHMTNTKPELTRGNQSMSIPMEVLIQAAKDKKIAKDCRKNRFALLATEPEGEDDDSGNLKFKELEGQKIGKYMKNETKIPKGVFNKRDDACVEDFVCHVCTVEAAPRWKRSGTGEITVDSAAEESVCPKEWGQNDYETKEPARWMKFVNASGGSMNHYGERSATFRVGSNPAVMSLNFQVSDVQKPLVSVRRITERGNKVHFGPEVEDNFIENPTTGVKIMMVRKGGSYVIPAEMVVDAKGF